MNKVEVTKDVYWVGAVDWDVRSFHGFTYSTHRGTSYNAYLIADEKIALVDTVHEAFADELLARVREIVAPERIDYIVVNHVEIDHSGSLREIAAAAPRAEIVCSPRAPEGIQRYFRLGRELRTVKTGAELKLGRRTLRFVEIPMLHWPDSMVSYLVEDRLLLSNDAFGQHLASSQRFAEDIAPEIVMDEAVKYYANILAPFSNLVKRKIPEIVEMGIQPKMIAPSHGVIWKNPQTIVDAYLRWASGAAEERAVILYDTMWGSTQLMARAVMEGIVAEGVPALLLRVPVTDRGDIMKEVFLAKGVLVGSSTINNGMLPTLAPIMEDLVGLKFKGKLAAAFGSFGWGGGAVTEIETALKKAGFRLFGSNAQLKWRPDEADLARCVSFGREFAKALKEHKAGDSTQ